MARDRSSGVDQIQQVKHANDLVSVMQEYVTVQRAGRKYKACCPFHASKNGGTERTPSLFVDPDKQTWKCFGAGCGRGGTVVDFVMEIEQLDFVAALKRLADRAGISLEPPRPKKPRAPGEVERNGLVKILQEAQRLFREAYADSPAHAYVRSRGIRDDIAERYGLGFAPEGWETLKQRLSRRWDERALLQAGLLRERAPTPENHGRSQTYDFFRNRLTIPIRDAAGTILGFGARALVADEKAKYINSPQTPVYDKSSVLFGMDLARDAIRTTRQAIVMEGYTDVILANQHGVENCIAPCGTALTARHLPLLRQADKITLLFDGDVPGMHAAERALPLMLANGVDAEIVLLPDDMDPADYVTRFGADAFRAVIAEEACRPVDFKLTMVRRRFDVGDPIGRSKAVAECLDLVAACESPVVRDGLLGRFAEGFGVPVDAMRQEFADTHGRREARMQGRDRVGESRPSRAGHRPPRRWSESGRPRAHGDGRRRWRDTGREAWDAPFESLDVRLSPHSLEELALFCAVLDPTLVEPFGREFAAVQLPEGPLREVAERLPQLYARAASAPGDGAEGGQASFAHRVTQALSGPAQRLLWNRLEAYFGRVADERSEADDGRPAGPDPREVFAECVERARLRREAVDAVHVRRELAQASLEGGTSESQRLAAARRHLEVQRMRAGPGRQTDNGSPDAANAPDMW